MDQDLDEFVSTMATYTDNDTLGNYNISDVVYLFNKTFPRGNATAKYNLGTSEWIVIPSLFAFIFLVGTLGNGLLILIVAANKNMRTTPNVLLVSLAAGDLLLIIVYAPFTSIYYFYSHWPFGEVVCKLNEYLSTLSLGVSVFTLTALSGERYMAIVFPMQSRRGTTSMGRTICVALFIWLASALLGVIDLYFAHAEYFPKLGAATCTILPLSSPNWVVFMGRFFAVFRFIVYFLIPILIIATFYTLMAIILLKSSSNLPGESEVKSRAVKQIEARKNVAKVVLACVLIFICCWLPRHVYLFWFNFAPGQYNQFWHWFKIIGFCLSFMNSCANPFALYLLSDQFRSHYNKYLFKCICCFAPAMAERSGADMTATRGGSGMEMMSVKTRTTSNFNDAERTSTSNFGLDGNAVKMKSKFVIFEGKKNSSGKKDRKQSNTVNGKIQQKITKNSKKDKKNFLDSDSKASGKPMI